MNLLSEIFKEIQLSQQLLTRVGSAEIHKIKVNKQAKRMGIEMRLKHAVNERDVVELKSEILEKFPSIDDLDININYIFENMDVKSKLEVCWGNIVYLVGSHSPVCGSILKTASWDVTNGALVVRVMNSGSFVMSRKGIDKLIQSFLDSRLNERLRVEFSDSSEPTKRGDDTLIKRIAAESAATTSQNSLSYGFGRTAPKKDRFSRFSPEDSGKFMPFSGRGGGRKGIKIIKSITRSEIQRLSDELIKGDEILIEGKIFGLERKETKSGRYLFIFDIYDGFNSITVKMFIKQKDFTDEFKELLKVGKTVAVRGAVQYDEFSNEINIMGNEIGAGLEFEGRMDEAEIKRVELHLHTQMSSMDGVTPVKEYIRRALKWGHKAIAITDHGIVQAFPEAMELTEKTNLKVIYGVEAYLVDDMSPETKELTDAEKVKLKYYHAVILVKNYTGLRNLYELVSIAHLERFYKRPRIFKSDYQRLKEGLIIGTACEAGEFYKAILEKRPDSRIEELAEFYDYFEIQPTGNNMYLYRNGTVQSVSELEAINRRIFELGEKYGKPVVATCDVHFINPEDEVYRRIIMAGDGFKDADEQAPLFFRTTNEMLKEFQYLGSENAYKVVVTNTNMIADMVEKIKPIPDGTYAPQIEGAEEELRQITMEKVTEIYGDNLPDVISERLDKELNSIIKNGFAVMYIIAQKLVWNSVENGYLVGSRGSVGSSFVATMAGITEVNPLQPHYICKKCKYSEFESDIVKSFSGGSGCDLPDKDCPVCGAALAKDGHDIPFETFLGFDGDKEPDIDLNFSGEYQLKAHAYTEELFGTGNVFKAGTIGTLADKTAYGYVKKYMDERNINVRGAEVKRLISGCTGIKKTTGQHPGGLMIVPKARSIYEFCPVQRPANDTKSNVITTHFDYHSISGRLLKLDLLGHDVPTIIRMLHDYTGVDPRDVPLDDPKVMSLFNSCRELKVTEAEIGGETGSFGLPEFGTDFVRQMLIDTKPTSFSDLVRISGLSHGTDVWLGNAQELIRNGDTTIKGIIACRDDIMIYLINMGVPKKAAFKIMENVRKGKGLSETDEEMMESAGVPDWYIDSCKKIKYLFPKGHAVAYVLMTVRIAYYKLYHPYAFYAATFSVRAEDFDYELMCKGKGVVIDAINRISSMGKEASAKDKNTLTTLKLVLEMYARNLKFVRLDIYRANASKFIVTDDGLMAPICSIQGLGVSVAQNIVEARKDGEFITIDDFREKTKTNKTVIEILKNNNILEGIPDTSQLSLF